MASKVTPSTPGAPSFSLASAYAWRSVSILQMWTYRPQKRQVGSAFALTYRLRLRSCILMGAFLISPLPPLLLEPLLTAGSLGSTDITPLLRYYGPVRHPLAFPPTSRCPGYTASMLRRFRDGARRASPVALRILVIVLSLLPRQSAPPPQPDCDVSCCLSSITESSASGVNIFGATSAFTFVTAR